MWIVLFVLAVLFVLGSALLLLRSANLPRLSKGVKPQPYQDDDAGGW